MPRKNKTIEKLQKEALKELKKAQKAEAKAVAEATPSNVVSAMHMLQEIQKSGKSALVMARESGINNVTIASIAKGKSQRISGKVFDKIKAYYESLKFPLSIPATLPAEQREAEPKRRGRPARPTDEEIFRVPKRIGRPKKQRPVEEEVKVPKRKGRPPKAKAVESPAVPKRRGRPPKAKVVDEVPSIPKKRGRPSKLKPAEEIPALPKKRGRPKKEKSEVVATIPKRRGRPPKSASPMQMEMPEMITISKASYSDKSDMRTVALRNQAGDEIDVVRLIDAKIERLQKAKEEYLKARQTALEFLD